MSTKNYKFETLQLHVGQEQARSRRAHLSDHLVCVP